MSHECLKSVSLIGGTEEEKSLEEIKWDEGRECEGRVECVWSDGGVTVCVVTIATMLCCGVVLTVVMLWHSVVVRNVEW
ncbi:hypothetical protein E2C01_067402 [Portunus trituberculatus]|uniref:Transmembrane protein n=1 Tax=Portunus trituberculatus TaxID=210409 RepID=A0A5B7HXD4_PORTR|nr:hypothetical protein [Portunus trituberculatus]